MPGNCILQIAKVADCNHNYEYMHEHILSTLQLCQEWKTQCPGKLVSYPSQSPSPSLKAHTTCTTLYFCTIQTKIQAYNHIAFTAERIKQSRESSHNNVLTCHIQFSRPDCVSFPATLKPKMKHKSANLKPINTRPQCGKIRIS